MALLSTGLTPPFLFTYAPHSGRKITVDGQRDLDRIAASVAQAKA